MWKRNLLLLGLCVVGAGSLSGSLLRRDRIPDPDAVGSGRVRPDDLRALVQCVDDEFHAHWQAGGMSPASRADDLTIARRLSLGLTGTIPSLEEIRALEAQPAGNRIDWWIERLLEDRRFADYVAERLARSYVGTENGPFVVYRRRRFVTWLSDVIHDGVPYDRLVRSMIAGTGIWTSSPETNFLTATIDGNNGQRPDPVRLAGRTARAFLGTHIDCLQCHDDNVGDRELGAPEAPRMGTQRDFHRLAAFYAGADVSLLGVTDKRRPYRFTFLYEDEEETVDPAAPFLRDLSPDAGTPRERLARWTTHPDNKPFARAAVNRVWAILFGRPLVEPIDDIPLFGELPPGMEALAADFAAHGFDLRRLIRAIAATEVYRLDSRAEFEITRTHERQWCVFPLTRLRPEQVAGALIQSASLKTIDANTHVLFRLARYTQEGEFVKRYGDRGSDEFADRGGTVTQRLLVMNGQLAQEKIKQNPITNASTKIALLAGTNDKAVEATYLAVMTRRPTPSELTHFVSKLRDLRKGRRAAGVEDIYWVLVNSTEFSWNH